MRLDYESGLDGIADWCLALPPKPGVKDWIVCIHGHGSHGNQLYIRADIKTSWLPYYLERGLGILTPNLRNNAWMSPSAVNDMDALLDFTRAQWGEANFYFASGSMGATSNLIYGSLRPDNVAGIIARGAVTNLADYIPFCRAGQVETPVLKDIADCIEASYGGAPAEIPDVYREHSPIYRPEAFRNIPVFLVHGTRDKLMPVSQSRKFASSLADNPMFAYIEIPAGSHDSPLHIKEGASDGIFAPLGWIMKTARDNSIVK